MSEPKASYDAAALLPCPWCGGTDIATDAFGSSIHFAYCKDCLADGPNGADANEAIREWNTRAHRRDEIEERLELSNLRLELDGLADLQSRLADALSTIEGYRKVTDDLCRKLQERQP